MSINAYTLKAIADCQLLFSSFNADQSLFNGKTGIMLFFFHYARFTGNHYYEDFAGELLNDVCMNLSVDLPITFLDGICGIGWSIEYMKKQGFIEGDTDEILEEIDKKVMERDLRRITNTSFDYGLEGIVAYIRSRLDSERYISDKLPFDSNYLEDMKTACLKAGLDWQSEYYTVSAVWNRVIDLFNKAPFAFERGNWKKGLFLLETTA